jgi:hypothetical protein
MKDPTFHKVIIENNVAKAIMQWKVQKQFLEREFVTLFKFNLDELKLRAGYADSLLENIDEYKKAIGVVMSIERSLKR